MRTFFRGFLIFLLIIGGVAGVITVDIRTGHMSGYRPAVDMVITEVPVEPEEGAVSKGYNLTIRYNKELFSNLN